MKKELIKSIFNDDPEISQILESQNNVDLMEMLLLILAKRGTRTEFLKGDRGETGERGPQGETGLQGPMGIEGKPGKSISGKDGAPGKDGRDGINGKDGVSASAASLIEMINALAPEEATTFAKTIGSLIDISYIRNANSFMFGGTRYKIEELMHGGGSTGTGTIPLAYDISTQFDGNATTFTLPDYSAILQFTITGWPPEGVLRPTVDFTTPTSSSVALAGTLTAPVSGTTGIILYIPT